MEIQRERIAWIDDIKGFMLILVCLAHWEILFPPLSFLSCMKVPMFFFLSGVLISSKSESLFVFVRKKVKSLLLPYVALSLLFMVLDPRIYSGSLLSEVPFIKESSGILGINSDCHNMGQRVLWYLTRIFILGKSGPMTGPLWFVLALFISQLSFFMIRKIFSSSICIVASTLMNLIVGWMLYAFEFHLPLNLDAMFTATFYIGMGYMAKPYLYMLEGLCLRTFFVGCGALMLYLIGIQINGGFDLFNNAIYNIWGFILTSVSGVIVIMLFFKNWNHIPYYTYLSKACSFLAQNSYLLLCTHYMAIIYTHCFFSKISYPSLLYISFTLLLMFIFKFIVGRHFRWMIGRA